MIISNHGSRCICSKDKLKKGSRIPKEEGSGKRGRREYQVTEQVPGEMLG